MTSPHKSCDAPFIAWAYKHHNDISDLYFAPHTNPYIQLHHDHHYTFGSRSISRKPRQRRIYLISSPFVESKLLHLLPVSDIDHGSPPDNFRITSIDFDSKAHAATVHFESPNAAKTALMLNGGTLDGSAITVTSETEHEDLPHQEHHDETTPIQQTDKPRAAIAAEYLAKGYTLSDNILQKAIDLDQKQGISQRFLNYLRSFDRTLGEKLFGHKETPAGEQEKGTAGETSETGAAAGIARHPTVSGKAQETVAGIRDRAKAMDEEKGYSKQASSYYERAINSPLGQKVFAFYSSTSKQVLDIHEEAKRIAAETKQTATPESPGKVHP
ncbi:hypothetical protein AG1IA_07779 [Rhizoctonia solani AG-1 IA]|uniref:RRM domain-containing protein n=1 Tax=Thanatephorus cucumeris (strain AG1-IA) TaxID=983506 RepID=L8WPB7_THACA|nr:hypothetical protein AG1IA_07779 [Rhizoctonia solani AG-1 IA]